jgi:signal transduction histidine kinase
MGSLRARLALLYAGPFVLSGILVLAAAAGAVRSTESAPAGSGAPPRGVAHHGQANALLVGVIAIAVMIVLGLVLGWLVAGRFLRPLRTIIATAQDISASNLHRRLTLHGRADEFRELGETLNDLFARLEAAFGAQRHFVANASHELRTPLTAERTLLQVALADPDASTAALRKTCEEVLALGTHQERLIEALLTLATSEGGIEHRHPFDLAEIADRALQSRESPNLQVRRSLSTARATGDPSLIESLVANLIDNALHHNIPGGHIEITTTTTNGRATITVQNTGRTIPEEDLTRLFQPFEQLDGRTTRGTAHGLGLPIIQAIATAHGAALTPTPHPNGGLTIQVTFP